MSFRRNLLRLTGAFLAVAATGTGLTHTAATAEAATPGTAPVLLGTLETDPAHAAAEFKSGLSVGMIELNWSAYEPRAGQFDANYVAHMKQRVDALRASGLKLTLGLGIHYTPAWAYGIPDSRFVDQNGKTSAQLNVVFNQRVRDAVAAYLQRIDADFGFENFGAVRVSSGGDAELLYPGGGTYWAFDRNAQGGADLPASLTRAPLAGWKPGQAGKTVDQVRQWRQWYVKALSNVADWQISRIRSLGFTGTTELLTPGSGSRPATVAAAEARNLPNDGVLGVGAVWDEVYANLTQRQSLTAYVSSVADTSGGDDSCAPADASVALSDSATFGWSATRWLHRIAVANGFGISGENPGLGLPASLNPHYLNTSTSGMMANSLRQATTCGFSRFYWAHDKHLWDGTLTLAQYTAAATRAGIPTTPVTAPTPTTTTPTTGTTTGTSTGTVVANPRPLRNIDDYSFSYSAGWNTRAGVAGAWAASLHDSGRAGATVTITFTADAGSTLTLKGATGPTRGVVLASLDGSAPLSLNTRSAVTTQDVAFGSVRVPTTGSHTVTLKVPATPTGSVAVDRLVIAPA